MSILQWLTLHLFLIATNEINLSPVIGKLRIYICTRRHNQGNEQGRVLFFSFQQNFTIFRLDVAEASKSRARWMKNAQCQSPRSHFTASPRRNAEFVATPRRKLLVSNHRFLRFREGTDMNGLSQRNNCRGELLSYDTRFGLCASFLYDMRISTDVETLGAITT